MGLNSLPVWVTSDSHFFHENIVDFAGRPPHHEQLMLESWALSVKPTDTILHLGDLFFGGREGYERFAAEIAPHLTGKKYLVLGNHDKRRYDYAALGFEVIRPVTLRYHGYDVSFAHFPRFVEGRALHVHGHIHSHPYANGELERPGNINVSVEVTDYRPRRTIRLLNQAINTRRPKARYTNSRHVRYQRRKRQKRRDSA